jgi:beta-glucosidase/6-phospho-beta-glucosidase/beta-galactosidase
MDFLTGFESTFIPDHNTDVLESTRHIAFFREDLLLVREAGIRTVRYPAPWHRIEREPGRYDWEWMDLAMEALSDFELDPIIDPVHHTSFPPWLEQGFADPEFPDRYCSFVQAFARRYPWVRKYTPFNEPFATSFFCGHEGVWKPYLQGKPAFVPLVMNVARAIVEVTAMVDVEVPDNEVIYVDTAEAHHALDAASEEFAAHLNDRRFLIHDLVMGRVDEAHPMWEYVAHNGARQEELDWLRSNPGRIDVLGLDYYAHSEHGYHENGSIVPCPRPLGFAQIARQYASRYKAPVMLTETNIRGFVSDRVTWLKYMVEQAEMAAESGLDVRGFCWFPFIDSTDWDSLLRQAESNIDPVGIYWLDSTRTTRYASELSEVYGRLARGEITSTGVPAYFLLPPVSDELSGFLPQMSHWSVRQEGWRHPSY